MYKYVAVTSGTLENCTDLLRIGESGIIEQYDTSGKKWRDADNGMSGIYSGDVECMTISDAETKKVIGVWVANAD